MSVLPVGMGSSGVDTGDIGHSLRCRSGASAYLSKSYTAGSSPADSSLYKKFISLKLKRGKQGVLQHLYTNSVDGNNRWQINFDANDKLLFTSIETGVVQLSLTTAAVFRDPTSWLYIDVATDSTQATATNRITVWVNGYPQTLTGTFPRLNNAYDAFFLCPLSGTWNARFGNEFANGAGVSQFDGYLARVCVVDNPSGLTASSFGYLNTEINEWVSKSQSAVKAVVDAGGTNSFMLDFDDGTSLTTLGYDKSSKGNNWTLNNFSLTAGTSYDWMLDVPGNSFATLNSTDVYGAFTLSAGNLHSSMGSAANGNTRLTLACTTPTYVEYINNGLTASNTAFGIGIALTSKPISQCDGTGGQAGVYGFYASNISWLSNGAGGNIGSGGTVAAGTIMQIAYDPVAQKMWVGKNNVWYDSAFGTTGNPSTGANPTFSSLSGEFAIYINNYANNGDIMAGQAPLHASSTYHSAAGGYFRYAPPTGFKALCQRNLPDPAILNPEKHFDVVTQLGSAVNTGANLLAQFTNFTADFAWGKDRAAANNHQLVDTVRGSTAVLQSNTTAAETTYSAPTSGDNCVAWGWKMGGAAVTNNNGSISSQVSANVLAGQSVVTYTGTGANATVGHGLASAPELMIVKARNTGPLNWCVYHKNLTSAVYSLFLDGTAAQASYPTVWNSTSPTTSVFSVGTNGSSNGNTTTFVAYCFHSVPGYSKVGVYSGNGSADGPFVECGFKIKRLMVKRTDAVDSGWMTIDSIRDPYNTTTSTLAANTANAESSYATTNSYDFVSTGFKPRHDAGTGYSNVSGATYIYYAIADVAGKFALGR